MATKAISFLGYTKPGQPYRPTTYVYQGRECSTAFMAAATAHFFQHEIDELLVLVTKQARMQNYDDLERAISGIVPLRPVDIPSGRDEDELWHMFDTLADEIQPGDQVFFDITNGFRSLPVLALLAASFVRVVRGATVERMIYGAFDAKDEETNRTPVFDLTPFVRLLDWTTATDAFLKYGRADSLKELVETASTTTPLGATKGLGQLAAKLRTLTAALQTSRPTEVAKTAFNLERDVDNVRQAVPDPARPFGLLLDRINAEYGVFGLAYPENATLAGDVVNKQLEMIHWYVKKGLFVQAVTLAREWLVSVVIAEVGGDLFDDLTRSFAESAINGHARLRNRRDVPPAMLRAANKPRLKQLWADTRDLRNDLGHTGMRRQPRSAQAVEQLVADVCNRLPLVLAEAQP